MARRWVIAGGGTGGHVTPALALGEAIRERGDEVLFIGSERGLEARLVPDAGFDLVALPSQQVMGRGPWGRIRGGFSILASIGRARAAMNRFGGEIVMSVGGYAAMPAALAAAVTSRPLFLVEPNAIPGRVNRMTARLARGVYTGFESTATHLPPGTLSTFTGVPLRRALCRTFADAGEDRTPSRPLRLMIFGGSQGAHQLNEALPEALSKLDSNSVDIFHQTGEADREAVDQAYREHGIRAEVVAFEPDMPKRYRWADLAICRAGALTVAELALAGMPSLLIPYPFAADDHQAANASALESAGAARRLDAKPLDVPTLTRVIAEFVQTPGRLIGMREAARRLARPTAADQIITHCLERLGMADATGSSMPDATPEEDATCNAS